jgi:predicted CoA-binding protein
VAAKLDAYGYNTTRVSPYADGKEGRKSCIHARTHASTHSLGNPKVPQVPRITSSGTFTSLSAVPHALDCVDLIISPKLGLKVVEEAHSLGIKHVFIQPGTLTR